MSLHPMSSLRPVCLWKLAPCLYILPLSKTHELPWLKMHPGVLYEGEMGLVVGAPLRRSLAQVVSIC